MLQDTRKKKDFANNSRALPENNILVFLFLFYLQKHCERVAPPLLFSLKIMW
jgi:hypothetical protein